MPGLQQIGLGPPDVGGGHPHGPGHFGVVGSIVKPLTFSVAPLYCLDVDRKTAVELLKVRDSREIAVEAIQGAEDSPVIEETARAQEFLWSAQIAVESLLGTAYLARDITRDAEGKSRNGVMGASEQELLRSALVLASAGVDASLKRLIHDSLLTLVRIDTAVSDRLASFAATHLSNGAVAVDAAALVRVLMADGATPREVLVTAWADALTAGSLQSVEKVNETCGALGVVRKDLRKRISPDNRESVLRKSFEARNQVIHELDLPANAGRARHKDALEHRRRRYAGSVESQVTELLSVAQLIIDDVAIRVLAAAETSN